jgi:hypothetical protein
MYIYGGHDYYDSTLAYGRDPAIRLIRGQTPSTTKRNLSDQNVYLPGWTLEIREPDSRWGHYAQAKHLTVVFCDKVYHGVAIRRNYTTPVDYTTPVEYFWGAERFRLWLQAEKGWTARIIQPWHERKTRLVDEYFETTTAPHGLRKYMIDNRYSILLCIEDRTVGEQPIQINPYTLRKIGFASALDPFTAFQELSMWVGGVLGGTSPEIVTITDDKVLAQSHGYDKHSFRGPRV